MSNDFLLSEFEQQYNQYRHLDQLRTRYVEYFTAFTVALLSASLIFSKGSYVRLASLWPIYFLLFSIGVFSIWTSVAIRMRQRTIAEFLKALRDYMASKERLKVIAMSEIVRSRGFSLFESAILLIFFLIFLDSAVLGGAVFAILYILKETYSLRLESLVVVSIFMAALALAIFFTLFRWRMRKNDEQIEILQTRYKELVKSMNYEELSEKLSNLKRQEGLLGNGH